uniref:Uncharacterized protein n=1 Tax=Arundo donax TaxID=35708 RepID=A0A0A9AK17_ARUDO
MSATQIALLLWAQPILARNPLCRVTKHGKLRIQTNPKPLKSTVYKAKPGPGSTWSAGFQLNTHESWETNW